MTVIAEPDFIARDPATIELEVFATWEGVGGFPLTPNQPEWLLLKALAYREVLTRMKIQETGKLNLLRYTRFPMVDYLGDLVGAPRLDAAKATATLRFTFPEELLEDFDIEAGTRARSTDGLATFETLAVATLEVGQTTVDIEAQALEAGTVGNGYLAGQVSVLVDAVAAGVTVENLETTAGGAAAENDARYIERLLLAPDAFSTAGGEQGYKFHALSVSQDIEDVAVISDEPLGIRVVLLDDDGSADDFVAPVLAALSPKDIRPQNDQVSVEVSGVDDFTIEAELTIYQNADADSVIAAATAAAEEYVLERRKLGRSATSQQVEKIVAPAGTYSVDLIEPAADVTPAVDSWARCTAIIISVVAVQEEDG